MEKQEFKLKRGIKTHGQNGIETIMSISLREPSWGDTLDLGSPYYSIIHPATEADEKAGKGSSFELHMNEAVAGKLIERLSGRTEPDLRQLSAAEGKRIADWIWSKINEDEEGETPEGALKNSDAPPAP